MALNFKIYETKHDADLFLADQIRKQLSLNPDSTIVLDLNEKLDDAYDFLIGEINNHPVSLSNVKLFLANSEGGAKFNQLDLPDQQIRNIKSDEDLDRHLDTKETLRKLYDADMSRDSALSKVKKHRMVTVILDEDAASKLDKDIREFYTYKFA